MLLPCADPLQPAIFPKSVQDLELGRGDFAIHYLPSIANHHYGATNMDFTDLCAHDRVTMNQNQPQHHEGEGVTYMGPTERQVLGEYVEICLPQDTISS